jgi:hypothetical protein
VGGASRWTSQSNTDTISARKAVKKNTVMILLPWTIATAAIGIALGVWALNIDSGADESAVVSAPSAGSAAVDSEDDDFASFSGLEEVEYRVVGTAESAFVTVQTPTGSSQAETDVPMRNRAGEIGVSQQFEPGAFLYISAQNQGDSGFITCSILVDGEVVSTNTSSGAYAIAQCTR